MPNDCKNELQVSGPGVQQLLEAIRGDNAVIDFQLIVPMPQILQGTVCGNSTTYGRIALGRATSQEVERTLRRPWVVKAGVRTAEDLKTFLVTSFPDCIAAAKNSIAAEEETGYPDWYEWSLANWGTKWNAYQTFLVERQDEQATIGFCTAWSPPLPVIDELGHQWPTLSFVLDYEDIHAGFSGTLRLTCRKGEWVEYELEPLDFSVGSIVEVRRKAEPRIKKTIG